MINLTTTDNCEKYNEMYLYNILNKNLFYFSIKINKFKSLIVSKKIK
jgi:hypothetical protein